MRNLEINCKVRVEDILERLEEELTDIQLVEFMKQLEDSREHWGLTEMIFEWVQDLYKTYRVEHDDPKEYPLENYAITTYKWEYEPFKANLQAW